MTFYRWTSAWLLASVVNAQMQSVARAANPWTKSYEGATALGLSQALFCTLCAASLVATGLVPRPQLTRQQALRYLAPVAAMAAIAVPAAQALYGGGNVAATLRATANLHSSLAAATPLALYVCGAAIGGERWRRPVLASLVVLCIGQLIATLQSGGSVGPLTGRAFLAAILIATSHFVEELLAQPLLHAAPGGSPPLAPLAAVAVITPCVALPILPAFLGAHGLAPFARLAAPTTSQPPLLLAAVSVLVTRYLAFKALARTSALSRHVAASTIMGPETSVFAVLASAARSAASAVGGAAMIAGALWFVALRLREAPVDTEATGTADGAHGAPHRRKRSHGGADEALVPSPEAAGPPRPNSAHVAPPLLGRIASKSRVRSYTELAAA